MDLDIFGVLANAFNDKAFPDDDVKDLRNGASHIPYDVTKRRRKGEKIRYDNVNKKWICEDGTILK